MVREQWYWVMLRLTLGLMFLWAYFDKLLGWGFATKPEQSWLHGGSPTAGFLKFAATGPLANFYHGLAGMPAVDWLFMLGLLGIGLALTLGVAVRFASWCGLILVLLMYSALLPPKNHPFIDEHILEAVSFIGLIVTSAGPGEKLGLGKWWKKLGLVQKFPWLQ